jgi:hypothetical protein
MNAWKHKVFCTWEFRITAICLNKCTTRRKMFKLSIVQVCITYKMGQLTAEQRIFKRLWLIWIWKGVPFLYTLWHLRLSDSSWNSHGTSFHHCMPTCSSMSETSSRGWFQARIQVIATSFPDILKVTSKFTSKCFQMRNLETPDFNENCG